LEPTFHRANVRGSRRLSRDTILIQSTILFTSALLFISVIFVTIFILDRRDEKHSDAHRAERQTSKRSRALSLVWRAIRWVFGTAVALVSLAASIYGILGGPFWPTEPHFFPSPPSLRSSFDVPFTVTNDGKIFSVYHLNISCVLMKITMVGPGNMPVSFQKSIMTNLLRIKYYGRVTRVLINVPSGTLCLLVDKT
jgi:hypothetical protein